MPISPSSSTLPGRSRTSSMPLFSALAHCAALMAGPWLASFVPGATLRSSRRGWPGAASRGAMSRATPQSTTVRARPCWRASTLTAAPPARKFSTICQVTSLGKAETPRAARPWSPAKTTICGCSSRGDAVPWIWPRRSASCSRRPSEPRGLVLWSSLCCRAWVSCGSAMSAIRGRWAFMACSTFNQVERGPQMQACAINGGARRVSTPWQDQARASRPRWAAAWSRCRWAIRGCWSSRWPHWSKYTRSSMGRRGSQPAVSSSGLAWKWLT